MIVIDLVFQSPDWMIMRSLEDENLWEVALNVGVCALYLPIIFESREEASRYINSATFTFIDN